MKFSELYDGIKYDISKYPKLYMYILEHDLSVKEVCFPVENPEKYPIDCIVTRSAGRSLFLTESDHEYASKRLHGEVDKRKIKIIKAGD